MTHWVLSNQFSSVWLHNLSLGFCYMSWLECHRILDCLIQKMNGEPAGISHFKLHKPPQQSHSNTGRPGCSHAHQRKAGANPGEPMVLHELQSTAAEVRIWSFGDLPVNTFQNQKQFAAFSLFSSLQKSVSLLLEWEGRNQNKENKFWSNIERMWIHLWKLRGTGDLDHLIKHVMGLHPLTPCTNL